MLFFILLLTAALVYFYYLNWISPKRTLVWYKQTLEVLGYNVIFLPFIPLKIALA